MDEEQLDDLKQFITATVSQTEKRLEVKISDVWNGVGGLQNEVNELRGEMADGFAGVGEAIAAIHDQMAERDTKVDRRLAKLEQQAA